MRTETLDARPCALSRFWLWPRASVFPEACRALDSPLPPRAIENSEAHAERPDQQRARTYPATRAELLFLPVLREGVAPLTHPSVPRLAGHPALRDAAFPSPACSSSADGFWCPCGTTNMFHRTD
ncbi:hypothetical protein AOLI_G00166340 [Acnodon oligacanthus]